MNNITRKYKKYPDNTGARKAEGGVRLKNKYKKSLENKPLVTIITVCFNSEEYIERCIKSVIEQTYKNIEYIIIDGGSKDKTLDIIKKYEDFIDYYVSEPDDGIYFAMNKGLELASGDYISVLSANSYYFTDSICTLLKIVKEENADYAIGTICYLDDNNKITYKYKPKEQTDISIFNIRIDLNTALINKNCYETIGLYDTTYKHASFFNFYTLLIKNGFKYSITEKNILYKNNKVLYNESKLYLNEAYIIISKNYGMYNLKDAEFCVSILNDKIILNNFEHKLEKINIKYNLSKSLYNELLLELYKKGNKNYIKKQSNNVFGSLFSFKKNRKFLIITILGIKISIRR